MKKLISLLLLLVSGGCASVGNQPEKAANTNKARPAVVQPTIQSFFDVSRLVGRSVVEVEKIIGKSATATKITGTPDLMPGEFRDYKITGSIPGATRYGLYIRYYRGKAVFITLDLPRPTDTAQEALLLAGFDVTGRAPRVRASAAERWTGVFNGIRLKDLAAVKAGLRTEKFDAVQLELNL